MHRCAPANYGWCQLKGPFACWILILLFFLHRRTIPLQHHVHFTQMQIMQSRFTAPSAAALYWGWPVHIIMHNIGRSSSGNLKHWNNFLSILKEKTTRKESEIFLRCPLATRYAHQVHHLLQLQWPCVTWGRSRLVPTCLGTFEQYGRYITAYISTLVSEYNKF